MLLISSNFQFKGKIQVSKSNLIIKNSNRTIAGW